MDGAIYTQAEDKYGGIRNLLEGIIGGAMQRVQQQQFSQDINDISRWAQSGGPAPQMKTRMGTQLLGNYLQQQLMSPLQQAQTQYYQAGAMERLQPPTMTPTQQIAGKKLQKIQELEAKIADGTATDKERAMYEKMIAGQPMVQIDMGQAQKSTVAAMEKDLLQLDKDINALQSVRGLYRDEFSTWPFKGRKWWATTKEKAGIKPPEKPGWLTASKKQIQDYSAWFGSAETQYLTFRKWATGVAGGPQEMAQIRQAFPDPKDKSPTEFRAMLDQSIRFKQIYKQELTKKIQAGMVIDKQQKSDAAMIALRGIQQPEKQGMEPVPSEQSDPFGIL